MNSCFALSMSSSESDNPDVSASTVKCREGFHSGCIWYESPPAPPRTKGVGVGDGDGVGDGVGRGIASGMLSASFSIASGMLLAFLRFPQRFAAAFLALSLRSSACTA